MLMFLYFNVLGKANEIDIVSADESDAASSPVLTNPPTPGPNSQLIDVGYNLGMVLNCTIQWNMSIG